MRKKREALIVNLGYALKQATYGKATLANKGPGLAGYCPEDAVAVSFDVFTGEAEKLGLHEEANLLKRIVLDEE